MEKKLDQQAKSNVLKKLISFMGDQMASRGVKEKKASLQAEKAPVEEKKATVAEEDDDECPHCDGEGCRFCK